MSRRRPSSARSAARRSLRGPARPAGRAPRMVGASATSADRPWPDRFRRPLRPRRPRSPSAGSPRSCSPTWSASLRCRSPGTPRTSASCCPSTSSSAGRSSADTAGRSRSSSVMRSWRCGACRSLVRTTPSGRFVPASSSRRRLPRWVRTWVRPDWPCGSAWSPVRSPSPSAPPRRGWSPATRSTPPHACRLPPSRGRSGSTLPRDR